MPDIDYVQILRDAWKMTWKNRFLWWFGWFILLPGFINPNYLPNLRDNQWLNYLWQKASSGSNLNDFNPQDFFMSHMALVAALVIVVIGLFTAAVLISFLGRGALIKSTQRFLRGEPVGFKIGFADGKKYFGKIFSVIFGSGMAIIACFFVLALPLTILFATENYIPAFILLLFAIVIIIPLLFIYKYVQTYACYYVVLADLRPWLAVENAYAIFRKNILASIIMSLLFLPFGIVMLLAFVAAIFLTLIVFVPVGLLLYAIFQQVGIMIAAVVGFLAFLVILSVPYAVLVTFYEVVWILFFHKIATPKKKEEVETADELVKKEPAKMPTPEAIKTTDTSE